MLCLLLFFLIITGLIVIIVTIVGIVVMVVIVIFCVRLLLLQLKLLQTILAKQKLIVSSYDHICSNSYCVLCTIYKNGLIDRIHSIRVYDSTNLCTIEYIVS